MGFDLNNSPVYSQSAVFQAGPSDGGIRAAAALANSLGGGRVLIPLIVGGITLTSPLPLLSGVVYDGAPVQADFSAGPTSGIGGSRLKGDGTFPAFAYNNADLGAPLASYALFEAGLINGAGVRNMTLENFNYGVKMGGLYNPGGEYCQFDNLYIIACTQWGFWVENDINCRYSNITIANCTVGQLAAVGSSGGALAGSPYNWTGGNATWSAIMCSANAVSARGIVFWSRASSSRNFDTHVSLQCNRVNGPISQAATMTNGSPNIGVTDSTKFPVDMPVTFSSSTNGFQANAIYYVRTSAANVITLSHTTGYGAALNATNNNAVNVLCKGYECLQVAGLDAASTVTGFTIDGADMEAGCTVRIMLQNLNYGKIAGGYIEVSGTNDYRTWAIRNCYGTKVWSGNTQTVDVDGSASKTFVIEGVRSEFQAQNFTDGVSKGYGQGISIYKNSDTRRLANTAALCLSGLNYPEFYCNSDTQGAAIKTALVLDPTTISNGGSMPLNYSSCYCFITAAGGTASLPTITANMAGVLVLFSNPQANPVTLSSGGENIDGNGTSTTSITVPAHTSIILQAQDTGSVKYWARFT